MKTPAQRKKLLIYAGVAGAILGIVVLMKRKAAGTAEEPSSSLPTYTSGPSAIPGVEGATGSGELATFENSLSAQLPQAIEEGVRAGIQANQSAQVPNNNLAETLQAVGGLVTALRPSPTGEQITSSAPSPSAPAPAPAPAPHPVATAPPAPKPAPPAYKDITCGNGCPGHKYPDGHSECMTKKNGKCSW